MLYTSKSLKLLVEQSFIFEIFSTFMKRKHKPPKVKKRWLCEHLQEGYEEKKLGDCLKLDVIGLKEWAEKYSIILDNDDEHAKHIVSDATYKLTWLNFPVLMCSSEDKNKSRAFQFLRCVEKIVTNMSKDRDQQFTSTIKIRRNSIGRHAQINIRLRMGQN
ncbi:hypothetical protein BpHYR1_032480 [Brachionus plicatilis]|uniref:Uncharacterized protein n=1 Tax=Brachionus plicatilis TaxID=10195 RepID=A0A3M7QKU7_BRAPC|nr:hypothetical protein BpHYR1_032480 [Brachionus plicatilis]